MWTFFHEIYIYFFKNHSFISEVDEFCFVVRLTVSKHRGQPHLQRAFGSSQPLPQSAGPRVRDERSPCLSAMATTMPSFSRTPPPKMRRLQTWKKHNLCLQSCVIHCGSQFPARTFVFFLGAWVNCGFNEGGRNFDLDIEGGSRKWPWVRAFAWIIDATDEWAYCFHGNVVPEIWMERGRIIMVLLPCRWHCDVLISVLPSDVTAVQARLLIQRPCNPLYRQWSVQLFKF